MVETGSKVTQSEEYAERTRQAWKGVSNAISCCMLYHATCYMLYAICYMLYAISCYMLHHATCYIMLHAISCNMLYAICYTLYHATCYMLYAICYMPYAVCYMPYATCNMLYADLYFERRHISLHQDVLHELQRRTLRHLTHTHTHIIRDFPSDTSHHWIRTQYLKGVQAGCIRAPVYRTHPPILVVVSAHRPSFSCLGKKILDPASH
jgi:hypothetical protein